MRRPRYRFRLRTSRGREIEKEGRTAKTQLPEENLLSTAGGLELDYPDNPDVQEYLENFDNFVAMRGGWASGMADAKERLAEAQARLSGRDRLSVVDPEGGTRPVRTLEQRRKDVADAKEQLIKVSPSLVDYNDWRKNLNARRATLKRSGVPADAASVRALEDLRDKMDARVLDTARGAAQNGAYEMINHMRKSIGLVQEYHSLFREGGILQKWASEDVVPSQALNELFGAGAVGAGKIASKTLADVRHVLGNDTPAWRALQDDAIRRAVDAATDSKGTFSRSLFLREWTKMRRDSGDIMRTLFGDDQTLRAIGNSVTRGGAKRAVPETLGNLVEELPIVGWLVKGKRLIAKPKPLQTFTQDAWLAGLRQASAAAASDVETD